jgi:hypothetical protein
MINQFCEICNSVMWDLKSYHMPTFYFFRLSKVCEKDSSREVHIEVLKDLFM